MMSQMGVIIEAGTGKLCAPSLLFLTQTSSKEQGFNDILRRSGDFHV